MGVQRISNGGTGNRGHCTTLMSLPTARSSINFRLVYCDKPGVFCLSVTSYYLAFFRIACNGPRV